MTWRERIVAARERGAFTDAEWIAVGRWACCAIGEQHEQHPEVVPLFVAGEFRGRDKTLEALGYSFETAVRTRNPDLAETILDQIEDRVLQLKREQVAP